MIFYQTAKPPQRQDMVLMGEFQLQELLTKSHRSFFLVCFLVLSHTLLFSLFSSVLIPLLFPPNQHYL